MNGLDKKPHPPGVVNKLQTAYHDLQALMAICRNSEAVQDAATQQQLAQIHINTEVLKTFVLQSCNGTLAN